MVTALPIITDHPILPPLGLLVLLAWRLIRPGFWPVWIGFPLGLVDDIFSGQPIGSAVFLWSTIFVVLDTLDRKAIQRDYWQDWFIASIAIAFVVIGGMLIADFPRNLLFLNIFLTLTKTNKEPTFTLITDKRIVMYDGQVNEDFTLKDDSFDCSVSTYSYALNK